MDGKSPHQLDEKKKHSDCATQPPSPSVSGKSLGIEGPEGVNCHKLSELAIAAVEEECRKMRWSAQMLRFLGGFILSLVAISLGLGFYVFFKAGALVNETVREDVTDEVTKEVKDELTNGRNATIYGEYVTLQVIKEKLNAPKVQIAIADGYHPKLARLFQLFASVIRSYAIDPDMKRSIYFKETGTLVEPNDTEKSFVEHWSSVNGNKSELAFIEFKERIK